MKIQGDGFNGTVDITWAEDAPTMNVRSSAGKLWKDMWHKSASTVELGTSPVDAGRGRPYSIGLTTAVRFSAGKLYVTTLT